jgi:hypothetical protein
LITETDEPEVPEERKTITEKLRQFKKHNQRDRKIKLKLNPNIKPAKTTDLAKLAFADKKADKHDEAITKPKQSQKPSLFPPSHSIGNLVPNYMTPLAHSSNQDLSPENIYDRDERISPHTVKGRVSNSMKRLDKP